MKSKKFICNNNTLAHIKFSLAKKKIKQIKPKPKKKQQICAKILLLHFFHSPRLAIKMWKLLLLVLYVLKCVNGIHTVLTLLLSYTYLEYKTIYLVCGSNTDGSGGDGYVNGDGSITW